MYKYIILCLCFGGVLCDLNKEEGADCDWEGVKGKCVEETRCFTTLDTEQGANQPVCSKKGEVNIICCTDCELVNDTRNVVLAPTSGLYWKDGRGKARDHCLQYIKDLPYECRQNTSIIRDLDKDKMCHRFNIIGAGGASSLGYNENTATAYPHQVLLGYERDNEPFSLETAEWSAGGSIISDRFILTVAHVDEPKSPKIVAADVRNFSDSSLWQTHKVKRIILHPEYKARSKYHDIALIELETPIKFDHNVLPACLYVDEEANRMEAVATTWRDVKNKNYHKMVDTIQTLRLEEFSETECKSHYGPHRLLREGYDHATQMCYGNRADPMESCMGFSGEPLLITTQFSHCVHTIIGATSFGFSCGAGKPDVYTRVSFYVPWIESVVWP